MALDKRYPVFLLVLFITKAYVAATHWKCLIEMISMSNHQLFCMEKYIFMDFFLSWFLSELVTYAI